ncbi:MAG: hypothetical protein ACRECE_08105 [Xanthobacteraceae bacterium]
MKKTIVAAAVAAMTLAAVSVSQAAPISPLPAGVSAHQSNLTQVQYWRWHRRHWGPGPYRHHLHRRCWWGPYHHWHCRWW